MSLEDYEEWTGEEPERVMVCLIQQGADVNQANGFAHSPFMSFSFLGDMDLIEFFMKHGADVNAAHKGFVSTEVTDRITPLMEAVRGAKPGSSCFCWKKELTGT